MMSDITRGVMSDVSCQVEGHSVTLEPDLCGWHVSLTITEGPAEDNA